MDLINYSRRMIDKLKLKWMPQHRLLRTMIRYYHAVIHVLAGMLLWLVLLLLACLLVVAIGPLFFLASLFYALTLPFVDVLAVYDIAWIDKRIEELEDVYLMKHLDGNKQVKHLIECLEIQLQNATTKEPEIVRVTMHVLHYHSDLGQEVPTVVLVHGTAGSCLSFVHLISNLTKEFNVYVVDLPGFGRSHMDRSFESIMEMYNDSADFHCDVLNSAMVKFQIRFPAVFCGHSFGGYVCSRFAVLYPMRVAALVLLNPAGLFPTLGGWGAYWALVFKLSVPNFGRFLGRPGLLAMTQYVLTSCEDALYWYYLTSHPRGIGHLFVREKITLTLLSVYWNRPAFDDITKSLQWCPITLVYGEDDSIMPPHQGMVIERISSHVALKVIKNCSHSPMDTPQTAIEVAAILIDLAMNTLPSWNYSVIQPAMETTDCAVFKRPEDYGSSFSVSKTFAVIQELYDSLIATTEASEASSGSEDRDHGQPHEGQVGSRLIDPRVVERNGVYPLPSNKNTIRNNLIVAHKAKSSDFPTRETIPEQDSIVSVVATDSNDGMTSPNEEQDSVGVVAIDSNDSMISLSEDVEISTVVAL